MQTANFSGDFIYPSKENPQFRVSSIKEGYEFVFFGEWSNVEDFTISSDRLIGKQRATGYIGNQAQAIEIFRDHYNNQ